MTAPTTGQHSRPRVLFVTNVVAHYRLSTFEELSERVDLLVSFSAETTRGSPWFSLPQGLPFPFVLMDGLTVCTATSDYYLDPRFLLAASRHQPDVVLVGGFSIPAIYSALYATVRRCAFGIVSEGTRHFEQNLRVHQRLSRRLLLRRADVCVAVGSQSAARFREYGIAPDRIFVAPYTTDVSRFWEIAQTRFGKNKRPRQAGQLHVVAVGQLVPRKGLDHLIQAIHSAAREEPGIVLSIVGSGPDEGRLRSLVGQLELKNVVFRGAVAQADVPTVYRDADVFAFPTLNDPFGLVLLEAAASGLPLVASPYAGATCDLVKPGQTGFVVDPTATDAMGEVFIRLARDVSERDRLGRAAYEITLPLTPAAAADAFVEAIHVALAARERR